jgi:hypothetical protein
VAAAERLHSQGSLHSSVWNVIAATFHECEIQRELLYRVASEWFLKKFHPQDQVRRIKDICQFAPLLALLAFASLNQSYISNL